MAWTGVVPAGRPARLIFLTTSVGAAVRAPWPSGFWLSCRRGSPSCSVPYRGYRAPVSLARSKPPTVREDVAAAPEGSRRLAGRRAARKWLDALSGFCPELAGLRADGRETHLEFARMLADRVAWRDGTTFHSREARCQLAGRGETAWKEFRRHLESWGGGWLGTVRPGRIYYHRKTGKVRHEAAVHELAVPRSAL